MSLELIVLLGAVYGVLAGVMLAVRLPVIREARANRAAESEV